MKGIIKITLAFALGIIVTTTVILPKMNQQTETAEIPPTQSLESQIQAAVNEAVTLALTKSEETTETLQIEVAPVSEATPSPQVEKVVEEITTEIEFEVEAEPTAEPEKIKAESTPTPTVTPSPQVKKTEPEYFYEDGKKYAYINGHKTYIAPDDEPAVSNETYDWANDPAGQIKGPFN